MFELFTVCADTAIHADAFGLGNDRQQTTLMMLLEDTWAQEMARIGIV